MSIPTDGNVVRLVAGAASVWFVFWAVRSRHQLDYPLDRTAKLVRWAVVVLSALLAQIPQLAFPQLRTALAFVFLAFLCWPNFAYHLTRFARRARGGTSDTGTDEESSDYHPKN